jgi:hypothetical protein
MMGRMTDQITTATSNQDIRGRASTIANDSGRDRQTAAKGAQVNNEGTASGSGSAMLAEGVESENYFRALAGDETGEVSGEATVDGAEESAGGQSEAPSIRSPHKTSACGTSIIRERTTEGTRSVIKTTKRKGSRMMGCATPEPTATTKKARRTTESRGSMMEGTEDTAAPECGRKGQVTSMSKRKAGGFYKRPRPVMEGLLANSRQP